MTDDELNQEHLRIWSGVRAGNFFSHEEAQRDIAIVNELRARQARAAAAKPAAKPAAKAAGAPAMPPPAAPPAPKAIADMTDDELNQEIDRTMAAHRGVAYTNEEARRFLQLTDERQTRRARAAEARIGDKPPTSVLPAVMKEPTAMTDDELTAERTRLDDAHRLRLFLPDEQERFKAIENERARRLEAARAAARLAAPKSIVRMTDDELNQEAAALNARRLHGYVPDEVIQRHEELKREIRIRKRANPQPPAAPPPAPSSQASGSASNASSSSSRASSS
jgi:hypothetical protein